MEPKMYRNVLLNLDRNHVHHFYSQCPTIRTAHQVFLNKEWSNFRTQVTSHRMGLSALISSFIQFNRHKIVSTFALNIPPTLWLAGLVHLESFPTDDWVWASSEPDCWYCRYTELVKREGCILQSQHEDYPAVNTYLQNIYIPPHSALSVSIYTMYFSQIWP